MSIVSIIQSKITVQQSNLKHGTFLFVGTRNTSYWQRLNRKGQKGDGLASVTTMTPEENKRKNQPKRLEGYLILVRATIYQEDIAILDRYTLNVSTSGTQNKHLWMRGTDEHKYRKSGGLQYHTLTRACPKSTRNRVFFFSVIHRTLYETHHFQDMKHVQLNKKVEMIFYILSSHSEQTSQSWETLQETQSQRLNHTSLNNKQVIKDQERN